MLARWELDFSKCWLSGNKPATSVQHKSKFEALHRYRCRLHMSEKFSSGTKIPNNPKQTNKNICVEIKKKIFENGSIFCS